MNSKQTPTHTTTQKPYQRNVRGWRNFVFRKPIKKWEIIAFAVLVLLQFMAGIFGETKLDRILHFSVALFIFIMLIVMVYHYKYHNKTYGKTAQTNSTPRHIIGDTPSPPNPSASSIGGRD